MSRWSNGFPIPLVGKGGLFLPRIVAEEEWEAFVWPAVEMHRNIMCREEARFAGHVENLYREFWYECQE